MMGGAIQGFDGSDYRDVLVDTAGRIQLAAATAIPGIAADNHAPADDTSAVVTYVAVTGKKHYLYEIHYGYDVTPTTLGTIKVEDVSGTVVWGPFPISTAGPKQATFNPPLVSALVNTAMIITLTTGGTLVQGVLNCRHEAK
jgi:multisubunit Na+/H+ antiporter MnhC subunit